MTPTESFDHEFENESIVVEALPKLSRDFKSDLECFVRYRISVPVRYSEYKRLQMGMQPEPYMIDYENEKYSPTQENLNHYIDRINQILGSAYPAWQWIYERLANEKSKYLLLNVLAYRIIGWKLTKLPLDSDNFWKMMDYLRAVEKAQSNTDVINTGFHKLRLKNFNLEEFGYPVKVYSDAFGVFNEFIYSQYKFRDGGHEPTGGDWVIDCGACFGGTSLYFANKVGVDGRVLSFEFMPDNLNIFSRNIENNPELKSRIILVRSPVHSKDGQLMVIEGTGPATQVHPIGTGVLMYAKAIALWVKSKISNNPIAFCKSTTIDAELKNRSVNRVRLIKMDIEGSEYSALRGAIKTIQKHKPVLAICVYHRLIDFYEVPQLIGSLNLGYKFYLQHSTVHGDETVIFAIPPGG